MRDFKSSSLNISQTQSPSTASNNYQIPPSPSPHRVFLPDQSPVLVSNETAENLKVVGVGGGFLLLFCLCHLFAKKCAKRSVNRQIQVEMQEFYEASEDSKNAEDSPNPGFIPTDAVTLTMTENNLVRNN